MVQKEGRWETACRLVVSHKAKPQALINEEDVSAFLGVTVALPRTYFPSWYGKREHVVSFERLEINSMDYFGVLRAGK